MSISLCRNPQMKADQEKFATRFSTVAAAVKAVAAIILHVSFNYNEHDVCSNELNFSKYNSHLQKMTAKDCVQK